ncbi:MAG TPA: hypothetical protein VGJ15_13500, partial [Pirellulales bacterium]
MSLSTNRKSICKLTIVAAFVASLSANSLLAQQKAPAAKAATPSPPPALPPAAPVADKPAADKPATSTAKTTAAASSDEKAKLLTSDRWKQMMEAFQNWLSTQPIYTPADVKRINASLQAQIQALPADEVQTYLDNWDAKLKILGGKNFQEAQQWLGAYLAPCTDGYRNQVLKQLGITDVANMSAAQLNDAIVRIRADRYSIQQGQAAFDSARRQGVKVVQQGNAAVEEANQQAADNTTSRFNTLQS